MHTSDFEIDAIQTHKHAKPTRLWPSFGIKGDKHFVLCESQCAHLILPRSPLTIACCLQDFCCPRSSFGIKGALDTSPLTTCTRSQHSHGTGSVSRLMPYVHHNAHLILPRLNHSVPTSGLLQSMTYTAPVHQSFHHIFPLHIKS